MNINNKKNINVNSHISTKCLQAYLFNCINVFHCNHRYFTHFSLTWPGKFWENRKRPPPLYQLHESRWQTTLDLDIKSNVELNDLTFALEMLNT